MNFRETCELTTVRKALLIFGDRITKKDIEQFSINQCEKLNGDQELSAKTRKLIAQRLAAHRAMLEEKGFAAMLQANVSPRKALNFFGDKITEEDIKAIRISLCEALADDRHIPEKARQLIAKRLTEYEREEVLNENAFDKLLTNGFTPKTKPTDVRRAMDSAKTWKEQLKLYELACYTEYAEELTDLLLASVPHRFPELSKVYAASVPGERLEEEVEKVLLSWAWTPWLDSKNLRISRKGGKLRSGSIAKIRESRPGQHTWRSICTRLRPVLQSDDPELREFLDWASEEVLKEPDQRVFDAYVTAYRFTAKSNKTRRRYLLAKMKQTAKYSSDDALHAKYRADMNKEEEAEQQQK